MKPKLLLWDMGTVVTRYTESCVDAVRRFNARLASTEEYADFQLPDRPAARCFLAVEGGTVRGGYLLNPHCYAFRGEVRTIAHYQGPISEGVLDKAYAGIGAQMLRTALKEQPLLFGLGMGGFDNPLPRMLSAMGWTLAGVPFYALVMHPQRFLRELRALRGSLPQRAAMELARATGAGWLAIHLAQRANAVRTPRAGFHWEVVPRFGAWADAVWEKSHRRYAMIALRHREALEALYPEREGRFLRIRVSEGTAPVGWAVVLDTAMRDHKHFGNLRVGSIVDCLALAGSEYPVIAAATDALKRRNVDLIVSNQMHRDWGAALRRAGFFSGPTNYVFAASRALSALIQPLEQAAREIHLNRGDGDGPIHL
jgi:hypothetical protein